ncbi:MAG TPA: sulfite exporter TauE/SafE family protein [Solirubrobacteraceae bacterium]|nr:sulfite exporter TauE/SafE family protein [Solirubrobacteraceae bacterium]
MHLDGYLILGSAVVGLLVGLTGAGGGALMTPMLILLFHVSPGAAISSDLVASVVMRPVGAAVHGRAGTINWRLVGWLAAGSVPAAFVGTYALHGLGHGVAPTATVEAVLGVALLVGAAAMVLRVLVDRFSHGERTAMVTEVAPRRALLLAVGIVGGVVVGLTSVGSGSLMVVALLFIYPRLRANQLVGTDLAQAVPLTLAAATGSLIWGHVVLSVTASLIIGAIPAVIVGSLLSSRVPDRYVRPMIVFVILMSGLKYVGLDTTELGYAALIALLLAGAGGLALARMPLLAWRGPRARAAVDAG